MYLNTCTHFLCMCTMCECIHVIVYMSSTSTHAWAPGNDRNFRSPPVNRKFRYLTPGSGYFRLMILSDVTGSPPEPRGLRKCPPVSVADFDLADPESVRGEAVDLGNCCYIYTDVSPHTLPQTVRYFTTLTPK